MNNKLTIDSLSSWTCLLANRHLVKEETETLQRRFESREEIEKLERFLNKLSNELEYFGELQACGYAFPDKLRADDTWNKIDKEIEEIEHNRMASILSKLEVGKLRDRKVLGSKVSTTEIEAHLPYVYGPKARVIAHSTTSGFSVQDTMMIKNGVLDLEKSVADSVFDYLFTGMSLQKSNYRKIILYKISDFGKISELMRKIPIPTHEEEENLVLRKGYDRKIIELLKKQFPDMYPVYIFLMSDGKSEEIFTRESSLYHLSFPEEPCILAVCDDVTTGVSAYDPWKTLSHGLEYVTMFI